MVGQHETREIFADDKDQSLGVPIAVLQDGGSASASELVAGVLQTYKRAIVFGQKSYGKNVAQSLFPLRNKNGIVVLTTSRYFLPLGESVKGGLEPDVEIVDDPDRFGDEQLDAAYEHLRNIIHSKNQAYQGS